MPLPVEGEGGGRRIGGHMSTVKEINTQHLPRTSRWLLSLAVTLIHLALDIARVSAKVRLEITPIDRE